ncbi:MAG TPA: hypothetical protein DCF71_14515 [Gemmatimonadetes bacterium]|nr:hypothetical protein [Gemmatimonadota bacterium]
MTMRHSSALLGLCVAIATMVLLSPALAQAQARGGEQWVVPRTSDGHPDLQGNWTNQTITPMQRREGQDRILTWDEVAEREGRVVERSQAGAEASDPDRPPLEAGSNVGAYNNVYFEFGQRVAIVNGEPLSSLITSPDNGRKPALTPEGERRRDEIREFRSQFGPSDNPENRVLQDRCLVSFTNHGGPPMTPNYGYNSNYTIVQTADYVMLHYEMVHDTRIIRLGEPDPLPAHMRPWFGDSWGRWEGNTLVVETTNIYPLQDYMGIHPTPDLTVHERFTRVDEETILYEFTVDDPTTYVEPWSGIVPFKRFDELLYEYNCHEGNYAMSNILSGARYQEREGGRN